MYIVQCDKNVMIIIILFCQEDDREEERRVTVILSKTLPEPGMVPEEILEKKGITIKTSLLIVMRIFSILWGEGRLGVEGFNFILFLQFQ
jgi:hypothetical protein